jgi:hypothetical protein
MALLSLSSIKPTFFETSLKNVGFKQYSRTYPGNYNWNFVTALSSCRGFKNINYSNIYLTPNQKITNVLINEIDNSKANVVFGPVNIGSQYLRFNNINPTPYSKIGKFFDHLNYGAITITDNFDQNCNFSFVVKDNNLCNIIFTKHYEEYFLCSDQENNVAFVLRKNLPSDEDIINPQDFTFLYSENDLNILLFKQTSDGSYILTKKGNGLELVKIYNNNIETYLASPFRISNPIYYNPSIPLNTSSITYQNDNNIAVDKSQYNLSNNLLLHKPENSKIWNIISLKNQLNINDIFTSGNNLLSGSDYSSFSDNMRDYTTISNDINCEASEELSLNYVFYNTPYTINPGENIIIAPTNMYPFQRLNVNDTKFVRNGAFSYITPQYSDKIYHLSDDLKNKNGGQHLLCTWLSGSHLSDSKVWVDRYYYPDSISKLNALSSYDAFNLTYDDFIENLIKNNSNYTSSVDEVKFFDKISDLVFEPDNTYLYERINTTTFPTISSKVNVCDTYSKTYPNNYFKTINKSGEFFICFNFIDVGEDWTIQSQRNDIDSGLTIVKGAETIEFIYKIYDPASQQYLNFTSISNYKKLASNFLSVGVNSKTGHGYFFFNDTILLTFKLPTYGFFTKNLLYGDIFYKDVNIETDILEISKDSPNIYNLIINDYYIPVDFSFIANFLNGEIPINSIVISLPCGMRNGVDNIQYLNSVCSSEFKSNTIDINIKNTNIDDASVLEMLKDNIITSTQDILPVNVTIRDVNFPNYK